MNTAGQSFAPWCKRMLAGDWKNSLPAGLQNDDATDLVTVQALTRSQLAIPDGDNKFPVLLRVTAAPWRRTEERAGVDIVAVLDVSGSMKKGRLDRMKQAMKIVIGELGKDDRLSIVSFDAQARPLAVLQYMSDQYRREAAEIIEKLVVENDTNRNDTNMVAGLQVGAEVLREVANEEESSSRVQCMMFVSGGKCSEIFEKGLKYICRDIPVHTFGLGADHDPKVMKRIADETSGTYSFVNQDIHKIKYAFALFIAGLTSVTAMSVKITLKAHEGVNISSINSGRFDASSNTWSIDIFDMYAGEQKNFIVYLKVPKGKDKLMTISSKYQGLKELEGKVLEVSVLQDQQYLPEHLVHTEVAAELTRIHLENEVSKILEQKQQPTVDELQQLWDGIKGSVEGRAAPKYTLSELGKDVDEMKKRIGNPGEYKESGLPYMLSWLSCHKWQRATTKGAPYNSHAFQTLRQRHVSRQHAGWEEKTLAILSSCLLPSLAVLAVAFLVMLFRGGKDESLWERTANATALDLSRHPSLPVMQKDLQVMLDKTDRVQIAPFFQGASVEDMNHEMDQYLCLAIVHATVLRRRLAGSVISAELVVRHEAEAYLQVMLKRMEHVAIPSLEGASTDVVSYQMNRYLYSTIVQASILRRVHNERNKENEKERKEREEKERKERKEREEREEKEREEKERKEREEREEEEERKEREEKERKEREEREEKERKEREEKERKEREEREEKERKEREEKERKEREEREEKERKEREEKEKEEKEKLKNAMARIAELEKDLQHKEKLVDSLRFELKQKRRTCAEKAAESDAQLKTCAEMADKWKAKVIALGGSVDNKDY